MSQDSSGEKTEPPSEKKLRQARDRGEVAKSAELSGSLSFLAGVLCVMLLVGFSTKRIAALQLAVDRSFEQLTRVTMQALAMESLYLLLFLSLPPVLLAAAIYTGSLWMQTGAVFSLESVKPKMQNLNPVEGMKKVFSMKSVVNFSLMAIKTIIVGFAVWLVAWQIMPDAIRVIHADMNAALLVARTALIHLLLWCGAAFVFLGVVDLGYQRWQFLKDKRMSMSDVKREHKEDEGDPQLKSERKRVSNEGDPSENLKYMPHANLVLTDRNGRLVVLIYRPDQYERPLYVLRGSGKLYEEALAAAVKHRIKTVTDNDLTARLFPMVSTGSMMSTEHLAPVLAHLGVKGR
jgi:type III secretion protein U